MDTLPVLTRDELKDIITGLAVFYDISAAEAEGPALKTHKKAFNYQIELARLAHEMKKVQVDSADVDK